MRLTRKSILLIILLPITFLCASCAKESVAGFNIKLSKVTTLIGQSDSTDIYSLSGNTLSKVKDIQNLSWIGYNPNNSVYVYLITIGNGTNLTNNKIKIESSKYNCFLQDFYSADDVKLSPSATKVAFRSFSKDDFSTAEGLRVFDIDKNSYLKMSSKVLVSGNLYQWLNEDEIIYYGIIPNDKQSNKIYKYNFKTNKEEVYTDDIEGYCTYFSSIDKNMLLYLESDMNDGRLILENTGTGDKKLISSDITDIYASVIDEKTQRIFLIAKEKYSASAALYSYSVKDNTLDRITYDFPKEVNRSGGMALDEDGNVYFCGTSSKDNLNNIYMYKVNDKSINLITTRAQNYYLTGY